MLPAYILSSWGTIMNNVLKKTIKFMCLIAFLIVCSSLCVPGIRGQAASLRGKNNEEKIFYFTMGNMGFNNAAGCGALANIYRESSFNPGALGDNGNSYGICQWNRKRRSLLTAWCNNNDYDPSSLEGQLNFMAYEFESDYPNTLSMIKNVSNSKSGAYNAAYYWCKYYEKPADTENTANARGDLASDTYWPKYKDVKVGLSKGTTYVVGDLKFKATGDFTVTFKGVTNAELESLVIPGKVTINGVTAKVTQIANNACKNNKVLENVSIGKFVEKIGKNAFYGCSDLEEIEIKSTTLKSVGKKAFKKLDDDAVIYVKNKYKKKYTSLLKGKMDSGIKIKKL